MIWLKGDGTCIDVLIEGRTSIKEGTTIDGLPGPDYSETRI